MIEELLEISKMLFDKVDEASYAKISLDMQIALEHMSFEILRMTQDLKNVYERVGV